MRTVRRAQAEATEKSETIAMKSNLFKMSEYQNKRRSCMYHTKQSKQKKQRRWRERRLTRTSNRNHERIPFSIVCIDNTWVLGICNNASMTAVLNRRRTQDFICVFEMHENWNEFNYIKLACAATVEIIFHSSLNSDPVSQSPVVFVLYFHSCIIMHVKNKICA